MKQPNYLEIIKSDTRKGDFHHAVLDFDGTISLIRQGWQEIMLPYFVDELTGTPVGKTMDINKLQTIAKEFIDVNTGKQTIYQCISLAEKITQMGGMAEPAITYKDEYHRRLLEKIQYRLDALEDGTIKPEEYLVPGSIALLEMLRRHGVALYLASGTDEHYVLNEAKLLGVTDYFAGHIYGAQSDYQHFSKKMVIDRIIRENQLCGSELIGFGDGYVEIENIKEVDGFACGVASNEDLRSGTDEWKRGRLIKAGADIIIPDYSSIDVLEHYLFD